MSDKCEFISTCIPLTEIFYLDDIPKIPKKFDSNLLTKTLTKTENMFEILSYTTTPQGKQVGYITCKFDMFVMNFQAMKSKDGGLFFTGPSFKDSTEEGGKWIKGFETDSKSAEKTLSNRFHALLKNFPGGYDKDIHGDDRGVALQAEYGSEGILNARQLNKTSQTSNHTPKQQNSTNSPQTGLPPIDDEPPF